MELSADKAKEMLIYVAEQVIASKQYLTEIDSAIGDGDHGIGMAGGMQKAKQTLESQKQFTNVFDVFTAAGKAMLMSMGGASGVIFGSLYLAGAKQMTAAATITPADFARMEQLSLAAIKDRGKAAVGDKTMVDALEPAVQAMEANKTSDWQTFFGSAEAAAKQGMEDTKQYQARFGRSKSLLERAIGHQDAGATSVWIIFRSMREFTEKNL